MAEEKGLIERTRMVGRAFRLSTGRDNVVWARWWLWHQRRGGFESLVG